jgi:hypothetical protein
MSVGGFVVYGTKFGRILSFQGDNVVVFPDKNEVPLSEITYVNEKDTTPYVLFHFYSKDTFQSLKPILDLYFDPNRLTSEQILKKSKLHYLLNKDPVSSKACDNEWKDLQAWALNNTQPKYDKKPIHTMDHTLIGRRTEDVKRLCAILAKSQCDTLTSKEEKILCILNDSGCDLDEFSDSVDGSASLDSASDLDSDSGLTRGLTNHVGYINQVMSFANALRV